MRLFTKLILFLLACLIINCSIQAQVRVIKPVKKSYPKKTNLLISAGLTESVLFLARNVKENNNAKGYTFGAIYGGAKLLRVSFEYTYYRPINIEPTWYNINSNTIESNLHIVARVQNTKAIFYPLFGISYNHFSGYFTGHDDVLNLSEKYGTNRTIITNWLGLNIGTGYEQYFGPACFFIDYKMRVGANDGSDHKINIMDVCISFGLRYNLKVPSFYKIFSGTKSRYFLDMEKD